MSSSSLKLPWVVCDFCRMWPQVCCVSVFHHQPGPPAIATHRARSAEGHLDEDIAQRLGRHRQFQHGRVVVLGRPVQVHRLLACAGTGAGGDLCLSHLPTWWTVDRATSPGYYCYNQSIAKLIECGRWRKSNSLPSLAAYHDFGTLQGGKTLTPT